MKFKINPLLRAIYLAVKGTVWITFGIFYRKQYRINAHHFKTPAPCIIVGNHPNTLVDVLIAAKEKKAIVHFLANASLFSTKFSNWALTKLYGIKVERPKDVKGRRIDNAEGFRISADFLSRHGTLFVAAEGSSKVERRLRKLKTGTARIALDTAKKNDWTMPLKVLPVGLTYEKPKLAGYALLFNFGAPIDVLDYKDLYLQDTVKGVKKLTRDIQASMQDLLLHTDPEDDDVDKLVQTLERIHKNEYHNDHAQQFHLSKKWIASLLHLKAEDTAVYEKLKTKINDYCDAIKTHKLTDLAVQGNSNFVLQLILQIIALPFAIWGWVHSIVAFLLPDFIVRKTGMYHGYTASIKLLLTVFLFPLTYWIQYKLFGLLHLGAYAPLIYIMTAIPLGFFALWYFRQRKHFSGIWNLRSIQKHKPDLYQEIYMQRTDIISTVFTQLIP